ncbi:MAG TPA: hypothetical protein VKB16_05765 [Beijerinckiaceae bacterium]|jgi:hypothetical protein|nr:hypothetical protein [Beijerinckiaceae bacterium]
MISSEKIAQVAGEVAAANLSAKSIETVLSAPASDSEGRDAVRITIVIKPGIAAKLKDDAVLDTLVEIRRRLEQLGEERLPLIEYATKNELEYRGDSES